MGVEGKRRSWCMTHSFTFLLLKLFRWSIDGLGARCRRVVSELYKVRALDSIRVGHSLSICILAFGGCFHDTSCPRGIEQSDSDER